MNRNGHLKFLRYNYLLSKKDIMLTFLLILLGIAIPVISGTPETNFWYRLYVILKHPFTNTLFSLAIGFSIVYIFSYYTREYNVILRLSDYKKVIKKMATDICFYIGFFLLIYLILAMAGAILFCLGNYQMIDHPDYGVPIILYIIFYLFRMFAFLSITSFSIYMIFLVLKKGWTTIIFILNSLLICLLPDKVERIDHFYQLPLLYHYYLFDVRYQSFLLELICSILELLLLFIILEVLYRLIVKKKRDLG